MVEINWTRDKRPGSVLDLPLFCCLALSKSLFYLCVSFFFSENCVLSEGLLGEMRYSQSFTSSHFTLDGKPFQVWGLGFRRNHQFFRILVGVTRVRPEGGHASDTNPVLGEFTAWRKPCPPNRWGCFSHKTYIHVTGDFFTQAFKGLAKAERCDWLYLAYGHLTIVDPLRFSICCRSSRRWSLKPKWLFSLQTMSSGG